MRLLAASNWKSLRAQAKTRLQSEPLGYVFSRALTGRGLGKPMSASCGQPGVLAARKGLTRPSRPATLDPDVLAFVEALARYAARKDHEAQSKGPPTGLN